MLRSHAAKIVFTLAISTMLFTLYGMENNQNQQNISKKYIIFFSVGLNMYWSKQNPDGMLYLKYINDDYINTQECFDFLRKPFAEKSISDFFGAVVEEYFFEKKEINNPLDLERYCMQLSCSGKVHMNDIDDRLYYKMETKNISFLELAIMAMIKEHKIDTCFHTIASKFPYYIFNNKSQVPSLQESMKKTICNELSYDPKNPMPIRKNKDLALLKRHFPLVLISPEKKLGHLLSAQLCNPLISFDMFGNPLLIPTIKDDNAQVKCSMFEITIYENY